MSGCGSGELQHSSQTPSSDLIDLLTKLEQDDPVEQLSLSRRLVGDLGAKLLSELLLNNQRLSSSLRSLDLQRNNICHAGAAALSRLLTGQEHLRLTTLSLSSNRLGVAGGMTLASALSANSTLTLLSLNANSLEDASILSLSQALLSHPTLTSLSLAENWVTDEGARAISCVLASPHCKLNYLDLSANWIEVPGGQALLSALTIYGNTSLHTIDLNGNWIPPRRTAEITMAFASSNRQRRRPPASSSSMSLSSTTLPSSTSAAEVSLQAFNAIQRLIDSIRSDGGLKEEGIFRVPGNLTLCRMTADQLVAPQPQPSADLSICELQDLASTLKLIVRELEPPLIPFSIYHLLMDAVTRRDTAPASPATPFYQPHIQALPARNFRLLCLLVSFLREIAENESFTRMTPRNLALILGPTVFRSDGAAGFRDAHAQNKLLLELLLNVELVPPIATA